MGLVERKWGSWGIRSMSVFYVVSGLEREWMWEGLRWLD